VKRRGRSIRPKKRLGQHFLHDPRHLRRIVDAADLQPEDVVLEIGPGTGTLTRYLLDRSGHVVAVEVDERLVQLLRETFGSSPKLTLVHGDILSLDPGALIREAVGEAKPYKVVANLPYYITSAIVRHLLESDPRPQTLVLTVQKEVAQRMVARPPRMNLLAVSVQFYGEPRLVHTIPRGAFRPRPRVDSAVVRIDVLPEPRVSVPSPEAFFQVVRAGFGQKRKQLRNALAAGLRLPPEEVERMLQEVGIDPKRRAETLSLEEWARLTWAWVRRKDGQDAPARFDKKSA